MYARLKIEDYVRLHFEVVNERPFRSRKSLIFLALQLEVFEGENENIYFDDTSSGANDSST